MESIVVKYKSKVNVLLKKFFDGKDPNQIDECLSLLFIYFNSEEKTDLSIFKKWIVRAVTTWSTSGVTPPTKVVWFTLSLASLFLENEERFNELNSNNFFIRLIKVTSARESEVVPSIKLAYIKLLSSFLEHRSGVEWMIACNYWEDIFSLSLKNHNDDLIREATHFMGKILKKTIDFDENFCDSVAKKIMLPLGEHIYRSVKASDGVPDDVAVECLQPTLKLIENILEYFLKGIYFGEEDFGVPLIFLKNFHLEDRICDFMIIGQKHCLVFDVSRITFIMQFLELYGNVITRTTTLTKLNASVSRIKNNFLMNMFSDDFQQQIEYCRFGLLYWNLMDSKISYYQSKKTNKKSTSFSDQLILFLLLPNYCCLMKYCLKLTELEEECLQDDFRCDLVDRIMKMMSHEFMRVAYFWRNRLLDNPNRVKIGVRSLNVLKQSRHYLTRNQAVMCFQMLVYFLKDFIRITEGLSEDLLINESYLSLIVELIGILTEDFRIGLRDAIEATYVMALCFDFLALAEWSSEIVVQVLKLVSIATAHYMAPDMALLVDSIKDSPVTHLGPFLYVKLLNKKSEVKEAALEVVYTIARMSNLNVKSTLPIFTEWIVRAVTTWSTAGVTPPINVVSFTLGLAGLLIENEQRFNELNNNNFFIRLVKVTGARDSEVAPSVKLAYIKLLSSFLEHRSGVDWMIACNYWEDIFNLSLKNHSDDLIRQSTHFMGKILEKTIDFDESFCDGVVKKIMLPLSENIYRCVKTSNGVPDEVAVHCLQPTLRLMGNILEYFLKGICFEGKDFGVPLIFLKHFHLEDRICDFMIIGQKQCLVFDVSRIMFIMQFLEMYGNVITQTTTLSKINASINRIKNNFTSNLFRDNRDREDFQEQIDFCRFGLLYWTLVDLKIPTFRPNANTKFIYFPDQLILLLILPNYCFLMRHGLKVSELEEECLNDDFRNDWLDKVLSMVSYEFLRVIFFWRHRLVDSSIESKICINCLRAIKESRNYLTRNQAVACFQLLVYFLSDLIRITQELPEKLDLFVIESSYVVRILEITGILIEDFQLGLKDAVETTYVMALCFDFLALAEWSSEIVTQVLKLVRIATVHYMAPDMALLVDSIKDSPVTKLGPLLYAKLLSEVSEVKKAALEVVCTIGQMSSRSK